MNSQFKFFKQNLGTMGVQNICLWGCVSGIFSASIGKKKICVKKLIKREGSYNTMHADSKHLIM